MRRRTGTSRSGRRSAALQEPCSKPWSPPRSRLGSKWRQRTRRPPPEPLVEEGKPPGHRFRRPATFEKEAAEIGSGSDLLVAGGRARGSDEIRDFGRPHVTLGAPRSGAVG